MKKSKFTEEQIVRILKEVEVRRPGGVAVATFEGRRRGSAGIHVKNSHSMPKQLILNMFGRMKRPLVAKRFSDPDGFKLASMTALVLSAAAALYKVAAWGAMPWVSRQMRSFR